ncbi:hypothetical protein CAEBREN_01989 [Caenorhabditis brenneri]|uniref:Uncharacterized protein n=1 Tax=Caenorhabditis brenneri TaxID=135651 RepID=G0MBA5_CAEBE|nr:hypothetical protein CAEBREN_01989 [Caenorhabditis brenneri]
MEFPTLHRLCIQSLATHIRNGIPIFIFDILHLFELFIEPSSRGKLKLLSICGAGFSPNFTSYISCNQALPQLEFIDISFNAVTEDQLKKLVQTHQKLSTVSLIGTPLQAHAQSEEHNVEFLTVANLESCIRSIKRYILATDKKVAICDQIHHILMLQNENHTEDVLRDCLQEVLNFRLDNWDAWLPSTRCLLELCRGSRIDIFTSDEVQKILVVFLHFSTFAWEVEELSDDYFALHSNIWRMFSECDAFRKHPGSVEKLCRSAAKMTRNCLCLNEESRRLWFYCVQVIHSCCFVEQDSRAYQHIIDNEDLAKDFLIKATYRVNFNDDTIKVFEVANVFIVHYATVNHHFDSNLTFYLIEVLWGSLYYEGNEFHQTLIHNFIHNIINSNRLDVWLYFQEPLFSKLTNWMTLHGHNVQKLTIMVFCWIKHYCECFTHNVNPETFSQMEWRATAIINTIHWYQPVEGHGLGLYEYLVRNGRGEVALWAKWILYCVREAGQAVEQMVEN